MAPVHAEPVPREPASPTDSHAQMQQSLWRRFFGREKDAGNSGISGSTETSSKGQGSELQDEKAGLIRRVSRKVVPGLPRAPTFKRQQSELRDNLEPVKPTPAERRAVSVDRRMHPSGSVFSQSNPRTSAPDFLSRTVSATASFPSLPTNPAEDATLRSVDGFNDLDEEDEDLPGGLGNFPDLDAHSMTTSQYDGMIHDELERIWILNLSMHFRDKSKREKFFVTYRENDSLWRRVTVSLDYRNAPENSLEMDLIHTKFQRDKSAKIYEAIRESLGDIQFYETVTNLKLQTTDGRLHVHVVEDVNENINYPTVRMIQHMRCRRVKEHELEFDSHMSGFVYKVRVNNEVLIKKEIPGPDTVDEFLYEINALNRLRFADNVIRFYGVVVDDKEECIKGLLISYAEQGALIDILYDDQTRSLAWSTRERWARQIVNGLSEIHEAGFVQGDFTLSNIVINDRGDAKIIDINRRGCPVGWEPPEATPLIESNQRISMYIGVKSDLYQLGMVLWALGTQEDEPEAHGRPLRISEDLKVPRWYREIVDICLSEDPRHRLQAQQLASMFPPACEDLYSPEQSAMSVDGKYSQHEYGVDSFTSDVPRIRTDEHNGDWSYVGWASPQYPAEEDPSYPRRGRSPPSPMPSNHNHPLRFGTHLRPWSEKPYAAFSEASVSDAPPSELRTGMDSVDTTANGFEEDRGRADKVPGASQAGRAHAGGRESARDDRSGPVSINRAEADESSDGRNGPRKAPSEEKDQDAPIPASRADSGKDLSDSTMTPTEAAMVESDMPSREDATHESTYGQAEVTVDGTPIPRSGSREDAASDLRGASLFTSTSFTSSRATSTSTPVREVPDDLKGIGSAYDISLTQHRNPSTLDGDFGMELDPVGLGLPLTTPHSSADPHLQRHTSGPVTAVE
ncbi:Traf2 and NCK-interacting protein kinase [Podospora conica]|nr:Traf2 and NCK-interacting protein kinase [Schizothecium conicum]